MSFCKTAITCKNCNFTLSLNILFYSFFFISFLFYLSSFSFGDTVWERTQSHACKVTSIQPLDYFLKFFSFYMLSVWSCILIYLELSTVLLCSPLNFWKYYQFHLFLLLFSQPSFPFIIGFANTMPFLLCAEFYKCELISETELHPNKEMEDVVLESEWWS